MTDRVDKINRKPVYYHTQKNISIFLLNVIH